MWFFSWDCFALAHGLNHVFTTYIDYPAGVNLMANTSMPLVGTLLSPITSIFGPVLTYNTVETLGLALSASSAYLLIRRHVASHLAAGLGELLSELPPRLRGGPHGPSHRPLASLPPALVVGVEEPE